MDELVGKILFAICFLGAFALVSTLFGDLGEAIIAGILVNIATIGITCAVLRLIYKCGKKLWQEAQQEW